MTSEPRKPGGLAEGVRAGSGRLGAIGRRVAREVLPPILAEPLRRAVGRRHQSGPTEWEYLPEGWPETILGDNPGWDADSVRTTQLARWQGFVASVESHAPFALSSEADQPTAGDIATHNTIMTFGWVLGRAAHGRDRLSLLDWGGGIGHYYLYARALLPAAELDYHCRDLPLLTAAGRQVLPGATFHDTDASAFSRSYDLVFASSSLHYVQDWRTTLAALAAATTRYLFITRQPFVRRVPSFVVIQRPHRHGYITEYPGWFLNRGEFLDAAATLGLELVREVLVAEEPNVPAAPEQADYRGFLFRPAPTPARTPEGAP